MAGRFGRFGPKRQQFALPKVDRTVSLMGRTPPGVHVVSESAVASPDDVRRVIDAGAFAVLVGTHVLRARDTGAAVASLVNAGR